MWKPAGAEDRDADVDFPNVLFTLAPLPPLGFLVGELPLSSAMVRMQRACSPAVQMVHARRWKIQVQPTVPIEPKRYLGCHAATASTKSSAC